MQWLRTFLKASGKKPSDLARHLDVPPSRVSEMLRGDRRLQTNEIEAAATFLNVSATRIIALLSGRPDPGEEMPPESPTEDGQVLNVEHEEVSSDRPDLPVWASAEAGDGAMILVSEPIDYIRRSERMQGVKKPFAFYVVGHSMSPVIDHGDQVVVNPGLPVSIGADCVFIHDDGEGTMRAVVKRLLRVSSTAWRVRQYNPPRDYDLPRKKWPKAFKIVEKRYH